MPQALLTHALCSQSLGGGVFNVSCAPPAAEHASYVVALVGVSGYTARVALPYDAAATTLRLFGLPDGGAAPLAGPAAGGTLLRLTGFGFDTADGLTCTFTYDTGTLCASLEPLPRLLTHYRQKSRS